MPPDDLIPYAEAARLLYPKQSAPAGIARVRRLVAAGRLTRHRNPAPHGRGTWLVSRSEVERLAASGDFLSPGRPINVAYDVPRLIAAIERQLTYTPARPLQVGYAREALAALQAMQAQQDELWRLRDMERLYVGLVEEFNGDDARGAGGHEGLPTDGAG